MIENIFNIAFIITVGSAFTTLATISTVLNQCTVTQGASVKAKLANVVAKIALLSRQLYSPDDLVEHLRKEQAEVVPIPDRVREVREYRVCLIAAILFAVCLLVVVLLLEFNVDLVKVPDANRRASLILCWVDIMVVLIYLATTTIMFLRANAWSEFVSMIHPR